ncbi:MAG: hypothetical protein J3Q66DRAFT_386948, partial [Benniella sp.]
LLLAPLSSSHITGPHGLSLSLSLSPRFCSLTPSLSLTLSHTLTFPPLHSWIIITIIGPWAVGLFPSFLSPPLFPSPFAFAFFYFPLARFASVLAFNSNSLARSESDSPTLASNDSSPTTPLTSVEASLTCTFGRSPDTTFT